MECHRSRLLDPTAVGSARGLLTHCLGRPTGWEKSWSYGPAACSEFHFFTDEQEDSAQVTSDLIAAGNTKVLQDRCIVFFYYIQTINTLTSESRTRNPLTFNSFLPLVCCLKISGARDPPTMASLTSAQTVRVRGIRVSFLIPPCLPDQSLRVITYSFSLHGEYQPSDSRLLNHSTQQSRDPEMHLMPLNHLK